jgi:tetratricopeptide (TPR) repeat protein
MSSKKVEEKVAVQETTVKEKESALTSFMEDPIVQVESIYEKNKKVLSIAGSVILAAGLLFGAWKYYSTTQEDEAKSQMFQSVYYFEADSLNRALNGDGNYPGLIEIAENYGMTKSGNLAKFYVGTIYLKQGKFEEAIEYLKGFGSSDLLVQARAYSLIGDAYLELKQFEDAVKYYQKASDYKPNKEFTPSYLMKLGLAQEKSNNLEGALETYSSILATYPNAAVVNDAKRSKGVVESALGK